MSPHEEKPTRNGKWTKPLMVAVPLVVLLTFLYTACQFTEPNLSFIPKGAKVERAYKAPVKGIGSELISPVVEVTLFMWSLHNPNDWDPVVNAILTKGFTPDNQGKQRSGHASFVHPNGDRIEFRLTGTPNPVTDLSMGYIIFEHEETRPGTRMVKSFMHWMERFK